MGASLPFTNGETESQRQSYSSGCPDRQLRMAIPPICRGAGALPVQAKLPTVDDQGHLLPGIGMAPGHSPLSLQISGVPQWDPSYLAASKAREGAGRPTGPSGPQLISGKGGDRVSAPPLYSRKALIWGCLTPSLRNWVLAAFWVWAGTRE